MSSSWWAREKKTEIPPEWKLWRDRSSNVRIGKSKSSWDHLREIAITYGIDHKHIPQRWTYEAEKTLYMWIGHAVVCRELEPQLRKERNLALGLKPKHPGEPKKGSRRKALQPATKETENKRKQRDNFPFNTDKINDAEFYWRFDRHYAKKPPKT
jgi:hypothetical protein